MHGLLSIPTPIFALMLTGIFPFLIPIIAIVMALSIPIVVIITDYAKRRSFFELHHKERLAAIEKGIELPPLPPELFGNGRKGRPRYLLRGLVWLFVGLGLMVALGVTDNTDRVGLFGLIPVGVGLACLIYYFAEGKRVEAEAAKAQAEQARPPQ